MVQWGIFSEVRFVDISERSICIYAIPVRAGTGAPGTRVRAATALRVAMIIAVAAFAVIGVFSFRASTDEAGGAKALGHYSSTDEGDEAVLQQLQLHGSNLKKPTDIVNYLYIRNLTDATNLSDRLQRAGYQVDIREPIGGVPNGDVEPRYSVVLHLTEVPSIQNIRKMRALMNDLAHRVNGDYGGWEAQIQP